MSNFCLVFKESCLKQKNATYTLPNGINFFIIYYKLDTWSQDLNYDFTLKDCLFGGVEFTKNTDKYSGYGIGLDLYSEFSLSHGSMPIFLGLI